MICIKESFRLNGLHYTLLKRNDVVALYSLTVSYNDKPSGYEVDKIYIRKDKYGDREHLPTNEVFGRDLSKALFTLEEALEYFDELTAILKCHTNMLESVSELRNAA